MTTRSRSATSGVVASSVVSATASGGSSKRKASTRQQTPSQPVVRSSKMRELMDVNKRVETVLVGPIERMLLEQGDESEEPRRQDVLHVSELAKSSFCPRAAFLRITGALQPEESARMRLQAIFEEGHDVHAKWQRWVRRLGRLYGRWLCVACESSWMGISPEQCPQCEAPGWKILYKEVPVNKAEEYFIVGHGDGQLDGPEGPWIEAKTIGIGTVRIEAPSLLSRYSHKGVHLDDLDRLLGWARDDGIRSIDGSADDIPPALLSKWVDFDGLWKNVRRPFPSHLKQGHLYAGLVGVNEVIFVYEYKPNQAHKEFVVQASPDVYGPLLEMALDVKWAVEKDRPPRCPHGGCKECTTSEQTGEQKSGQNGSARRSATRRTAHDRPDVGGHADNGVGEGGGREGGAGVRPSTRRRVTRTPRRPDDAGRQPVDDAVHEVRGLGRLLR